MTVYRPRRLPHAILSTLEAEPMFLGDLQAQVPSDLPHRKLGRKVYLTLGALMRDGFVRATVDGYSLTDDGRDALRDLRAGMTVTTDAPVTSVRVFVDRRAAA